VKTTVFTPQQIANMLNISLGLVYKEIERGSIRAIKLGRIYRIPLKEKERIVDGREDLLQ